MRHWLLVALAATLLVLAAAPTASAREPAAGGYPRAGDMRQVEALADAVAELARGTWQGADLFAHRGTRLEAATVGSLQQLAQRARFFARTVERHGDDPRRTRRAFAALLHEYCRAGDRLWTVETYGPYGFWSPRRFTHMGLGPARAGFDRMARVMDELQAYYGYLGCGAYGRAFPGRIGLTD